MAVTYYNGFATKTPLFKCRVGRAVSSTASIPKYGHWTWEERLSVVSIAHKSNGDVNECILSYDIGTSWAYSQVEIENIGNNLDGDSFGLNDDDLVEVWEFDANFNAVAVVFVGFVVNTMRAWSSSGYTVSYVIVGPEYRLNDAKIRGSYSLDYTVEQASAFDPGDTNVNLSTVILTGRDCHFNPQGLPNRSNQYGSDTSGESHYDKVYYMDGADRNLQSQNTWGSATTFSALSKFWTVKDAVIYLLYYYKIDDWVILNGRLDEQDSIFNSDVGEVRVRDTNVDGMSVLEALRVICEPNGIGFRFAINYGLPGRPKSRNTSANTLKPVMTFYRVDQGEEIQLHWDVRGTSVVNGQLSSIQQGSINQDIFNAANVVNVSGGYKQIQGMFKYVPKNDQDEEIAGILQGESDLIDGWSLTSESDLSDEFKEERYNADSKDFWKYKDVGRKFILCEEGVFQPAFVTGFSHYIREPYDFSQLFETNNFIRKKRRFLPPLQRQDQSLTNNRYKTYVEWSPDTGVTFYPLANVRYLQDECGIYVNKADLDDIVPEGDDDWNGKSFWQALVNRETEGGPIESTLRLKVVATVESDDRIEVTADQTTESVSSFALQHAVKLPRAFVSRKTSLKVSPYSGDNYTYANSLIGNTVTDSRDDTLKVRSEAVNRRDIADRRQLHTSFIIRSASLSFWPGQKITAINGRNIDLLSKKQNQPNSPMIIQVNHIFGETQATEIMTETTVLNQVRI